MLIKPYVKDYLLAPINLAIEWRVLYVDRPGS
jgi:hypothetical protein